MPQITISVHEQDGELLASPSEIEASLGDSVAIQSALSRPLEIVFTDSQSTAAFELKLGPFDPTQAIVLEIPHDNGSFLADTLSVVSDGRWPKIMIRRPTKTGGG